MTDEEFQDLANDLESDRVERKALLADPDRVCQAICAFANDMPNYQMPGVVFVGAKDDGSCAGLEISDQLLQNLAHLRSDGNTVPIPSMTVQKRTINGCEMAVVIKPHANGATGPKAHVPFEAGRWRARLPLPSGAVGTSGLFETRKNYR